jgi:arabinogalactan endo-1,4-beta-galactosidase
MLCSSPGIDIFSQKVYVGTTMGFTDYLEKNCGVVYKESGEPADPFVSLSEHGANIVRFRVGFPPYSSSYSNGQVIDHESPENVKTGMQRAKDAGLKSLLSFSYQSFALEDSQKLNDYVAPLEWQSFASDVDRLADSVYRYTFDILDYYCSSGLIPEIVSIGNESVWRRMEPNVPENQLPAYDPQRSVTLHNAGSQAVRDISVKYNFPIKVCFHMMTPAQTEWWLNEHSPYGLNFDMIGISLYYGWYNNNYGSYNSLGRYVAGITGKYGIDFLVMETAQLFTSGGIDNHVDILGAENIPAGYPNPPTTETQKKYLIDITTEVINNGGSGVITWGGEWVGSNCFIYADAWGAGSSWENKTFWDFDYNLQDGVNWMLPFSGKVPVIFKVNMTGVDVSKGVFIKGDIRNKNGKTREFIRMQYEGNNIYTHTSYIPPDSTGAFYYLNDSSESARESVPDACALQSGSDRRFYIPLNSKGEVFLSAWSSCDTIPKYTLSTHITGEGSVSPPAGTYALNTDVTLTATPAPGWNFTEWSGDLSGTGNPMIITMDLDKDITAKFVEKPIVTLTFKVDMTGISVINGVYVTGEFENLKGLPWVLNKMVINEGNNIYSYSTWAHIESSGAYYFLNDNYWNAREYVPGSCVEMWNSDRKYVVNQNDTIFGYKWSSCNKIGTPVNFNQESKMSGLTVYPNPVLNREIVFHCELVEWFSFTIYDLVGRSVCFSSLKVNQGKSTTFQIPENIKNGFYILDIMADKERITQKILIQ